MEHWKFASSTQSWLCCVPCAAPLAPACSFVLLPSSATPPHPVPCLLSIQTPLISFRTALRYALVHHCSVTSPRTSQGATAAGGARRPAALQPCSQPAQLPPSTDFHPLAVPTSNLTSAFLQTQPTALARLHLLPPVLPLDPGQGRLCLQQSGLCRTAPRGRCRWAAPCGMAHMEPPLKELSHVPSACTPAGLPGSLLQRGVFCGGF